MLNAAGRLLQMPNITPLAARACLEMPWFRSPGDLRCKIRIILGNKKSPASPVVELMAEIGLKGEPTRLSAAPRVATV